MKEMCGIDCCGNCGMLNTVCDGCEKTDGHPCGGECVAAECVRAGGTEEMKNQKNRIIEEVNSLEIDELHIDDLNLVNGSFVNLEYNLPNGQQVKLLNDNKVYWGNQVEKTNGDRCFGLAADEKHLLVCEYGCNGADPEIIIYKKR